ncbi:hypothetical protein GKE82_12490 [Conexibacter sp. W3-3-2]|uniref:SHOCT domain-containing protein n=1 Tax=Conexibacter sp. W3-3-2 TaxID=2675227 RepID=UPI0012B83D50|nr:SHOCT domain-containing protein [Conexibacter sp. W3-3-2]MTD45087.1 hypothetical protein [Conexibacter sp. W3-3-2]
MSRLLRLLGAVAIVGLSIVLATAAIYELIRTGTCGAPPGAVAVRPCPEGTGGQVLQLIGSIFVLPAVGIALAPVARQLLAGLWWCYLWLAMGAAAMVVAYGPASPPGSSGDALGVGITFLAIGGFSLLLILGLMTIARRGSADAEEVLARARAEGRLGPTRFPADGDAMATLAGQLGAIARAREATDDDPVAGRLRKLDELRAAGLITDAEHAARRRAILDEL